MNAMCSFAPKPGNRVRVLSTGAVGRVRCVDLEWQRLFPHKGPMLTLDVEGDRRCYSLCELEPLRDEPAYRSSH